ncbi:hypothetical protein NIES2119_02485 [[Phormidium ambiguum] IAM M-71]|uniref:Uncharacterized protein n=1 Tax=[Phormidium ambiguum] IAM M-71 TaxID=454136 RepID=A0A1U7ISL6_9CYAN|nr:hypothetical protein NIES2119_02485 [Phormidium ambiguum IAM M-71]
MTSTPKLISFTQMIDTNRVGAGLAKSLEYPAIRLKSKPGLDQAFVAIATIKVIKPLLIAQIILKSLIFLGLTLCLLRYH